METATLFGIFFTMALLSMTGYSLYTAFGSPSDVLRDPFEDHED
uniref:Protein PsbN n=1 Tax=prasinophyte sp. MBIC10622 TaxID=156113 RepID=A0A088CJP6_9CHLO|nr:N protein of photosystem II [prasinophyte sp. MBIC10622]